VAAEVIGGVDGSIGEMLYESKVYFMTADLFAWTILIILLSIVLEKAFLFLLKRAFAGVEKL
ncbi:MAG: nitrate ABC transporter permease, partial [Oscillospiraceae bacterium]|nr:nitrate ABC transporter permease [Oscillospiraceae bacterium]